MEYPIVTYAHKIKKNTAEFTAGDMAAFTKWWITQPKSVQKEWMEQMTARSERVKNAMTNRLPVGVVEEIEEVVEEVKNDGEVIVEMGLTKADVEALKFAITRCFADYDMEEHEMGISLRELLTALEGV
jgi:predicted metal-dependent peptidase